MRCLALILALGLWSGAATAEMPPDPRGAVPVVEEDPVALGAPRQGADLDAGRGPGGQEPR